MTNREAHINKSAAIAKMREVFAPAPDEFYEEQWAIAWGDAHGEFFSKFGGEDSHELDEQINWVAVGADLASAAQGDPRVPFSDLP